ncbi:MAG: UDP-glucose 4-epimerase GalE [Sphaerobacteraceae bacterium]|nr:MAG: UDP-glucose 4-epimerase GalE [Sphaerobacteraceae bacterium]
MRVLVVGGAGYIGSHTALTLAEAGHQPVVFDNLTMGHEWAVQWGEFVQGDLSDADLLRKVLREHQIEAVIHFAAFAYVGESVQNPRKYFENNLVSTLSLLHAMLDSDVRQIIFSSTCASYGIPEQVPINESHPQNPINPYGDSKLMVERILHWYGEAYDLKWIALRYFNAAGADPQGRIGESHDPETHLIPLVIDAALERRGPVQIFGTDYATQDGTAVRDYIHVLDLADAHVRALEYLAGGGESQPINLGTGRGYSVREVVESVGRVSGRPVPFEEGPRREGDPPELVADPSRALEVLGWRARYQELDDIVGTAWEWHSKS